MLGVTHQAFIISFRGGQYIGKRYFENRLKFDIIIRFSLGTKEKTCDFAK